MNFAFILVAHLIPNVLGIDNSWYSDFRGKRPFVVQTTRFQCSNQPKYSVVEECKLTLRRNALSTLSFRGTFLRPLEPVFGTMKIWYKNNANIWRPLLGLDEWNNICTFLNTKYENLDLLQKVYVQALNGIFPNRWMRCPLQGTIEFKNFSFQEGMFPPFVPAGNYRNDMAILSENNVTVFGFQFYGTVRAKGIVDLSMG